MSKPMWYEVSSDALDTWIEAWHNIGSDDPPLHEYLGMTWEEMGCFVEKGLDAAKEMRGNAK